MHQIIWVIGLLLAAMLFLCVGVILRKDHRFRSEHISQNARMKADKIHCATSQDREARQTKSSRIEVKNL